MPSPTTFLYAHVVQNILMGALSGPGNQELSAHLMMPGFVPDQLAQKTFSDVAVHELLGRDYKAKRILGAAVSFDSGVWSFTSDALIFGDPVTVSPFRFLVMAYGLPGASAASKTLLACSDLAPSGGALEAVAGSLVISPPSGGWFSIEAQQ